MAGVRSMERQKGVNDDLDWSKEMGRKGRADECLRLVMTVAGRTSLP
jgi:hypothetical protein